MKNNKISRFCMAILVLLFAFSISNCSVQMGTNHTHSKKVPPGHAKKANGSKSAKKYAPGQNK